MVPLFIIVAAAGIRYLGYAEFTAAGRFLWAGLRPMLGAHVKLELLERSLAAATNVEECWQALARAGNSLGYCQMVARLGGDNFSFGPSAPQATPFWQMRMNLAPNCFVNISHEASAAEQPILLIPFTEIVRRVLPVKLKEFENQSVWRNSKTTTVMSSDCAAPSVKPATAS